MFKVTIIAVACLASALAYPVDTEDIFKDETGQQYLVYLLVPISDIEPHRVRRQTDYGVGSGGAFISHKETLFNNDRHKVDGSVFAERQFAPKGPLTTGNKVDYTYKPSASTFSVGTSNTRGQGTDLTASGQYNFFKSQDGKAKVGAYGEYSRHFHGPGGTQHPQWEAGVRGSVDF